MIRLACNVWRLGKSEWSDVEWTDRGEAAEWVALGFVDDSSTWAVAKEEISDENEALVDVAVEEFEVVAVEEDVAVEEVVVDEFEVVAVEEFDEVEVVVEEFEVVVDGAAVEGEEAEGAVAEGLVWCEMNDLVTRSKRSRAAAAAKGL